MDAVTKAPFPAADWPALKAKARPLTKIHPYEKNARTHPPAQITLLAEAMKRWGVDQPIVVDEAGVIIKGHGRRLAAIEAGFTTFPVVVRTGMTEAEKNAERIRDNQMGLLSGWDQDLLRAGLVDLKLAGYDMPLVGFSDVELKEWGVNVIAMGEMPMLPTGQRSEFQQMTFVLHESQVPIVAEAIKAAYPKVKAGMAEEQNKNKNGLALVEICRAFLKAGQQKTSSSRPSGSRKRALASG